MSSAPIIQSINSIPSRTGRAWYGFLHQTALRLEPSLTKKADTWQFAGAASATESRPMPEAAEVFFLKGDVLPLPTLYPLREMHRAGSRSRGPEGRRTRT